MRQNPQRYICSALFVAAALGSFAGAAYGDPVTYVCTSNAYDGATYMKLDEKLKMVWMGRSLTDAGVKEPAFFNRYSVTWTHLVETRSWNYTFDRATGVTTYGWGTGYGESQQDNCKKIIGANGKAMRDATSGKS